MTPRLDLRCADCGIRHRAVCARCDETELARLEEVKFYRTYEAGQKIVWAGDDLSFVASVVSGIATMAQTLEDGRVQMVGLLLPSDFIGRPGRTSTPYDITAASDVTLCCFRRAPFERLLADMPHVAGRLLEMTLDELDAAREWMMVLGRKTARERIASLLVSVARREASFDLATRPRDIRLDLPLTRGEMASMLGLTIETISRSLTRLESAGAIRRKGARGIELVDPARLECVD